jgi:dTMP kinase
VLYGEKRPPITVEALLFAADRIEHLQNEVQPALADGQIVVSDRYLYSSLAYQGSAGLSLDWIEAINQYALKPDLALFIDVDPEAVFHRLKQKKSVMEKLETQQEVRKIYLQFVAKGILMRINGDQAKRQVADEIYAVVDKYLKTHS